MSTRCRRRPVSRLILQDDEFVVIDGEDFQSSFNLFRLPRAWRGYMAFAKRVPARLFGVNSDSFLYVALQVVPMGVGRIRRPYPNCFKVIRI